MLNVYDDLPQLRAIEVRNRYFAERAVLNRVLAFLSNEIPTVWAFAGSNLHPGALEFTCVNRSLYMDRFTGLTLHELNARNLGSQEKVRAGGERRACIQQAVAGILVFAGLLNVVCRGQ